MKTTSVIMLLVLSVLFAFGQEPNEVQDSTGQMQYSFGQHGIEITLDELWNPIQHSMDRWELLYGCSGTEKCPNIQVNFYLLDSLTDFDGIIDYVIGAHEKQYSDLVYTKSTVMINDIEFKIVDFHIRYVGNSFGQTVILFETNKEWVNFVFTGDFHKNRKQAVSAYTEERSRFMSILQSLKIVETEATATGPTSTMQLSKCNDTTSYISIQMDSLNCYVKLKGAVQLFEGFACLEEECVKSVLANKEPFLPEEERMDSDTIALNDFISNVAGLIYYRHYPGAANHNYYSIPLGLEYHALLWYPVDSSPIKMKRIIKQMKSGKIEHPPAINGQIYVSTLVDNYVFSISAIYNPDRSINEIKDLLSVLLRSMKYTYDQVDSNSLCESVL